MAREGKVSLSLENYHSSIDLQEVVAWDSGLEEPFVFVLMGSVATGSVLGELISKEEESAAVCPSIYSSGTRTGRAIRRWSSLRKITE